MRKINHCCIVAGTALLVACATPAPLPTPSPAQTQTQTLAPAQAQTAGEKFTVPTGYKKAMVHGQVEYCRTDVDTGSRISRTTICYTVAQLQSEQANNQNNLSDEIRNNNSLEAVMGVHTVGPTGR